MRKGRRKVKSKDPFAFSIQFYTHLLPRDVHHVLMNYLDAVDVIAYADHLRLGPEPSGPIDLATHDNEANVHFWSSYCERSVHGQRDYSFMRERAGRQRALLRESLQMISDKQELLRLTERTNFFEYDLCSSCCANALKIAHSPDVDVGSYRVILTVCGITFTITDSLSTPQLPDFAQWIGARCSSVPQLVASVICGLPLQIECADVVRAIVRSWALNAVHCPNWAWKECARPIVIKSA